LILGLLELEEGQRAAVADPKETASYPEAGSSFNMSSTIC
jgi:hypothetical protein